MSPMLIVGIDLGLKGAISVLLGDGDLFKVFDMPTIKVGKKIRYDVCKVNGILSHLLELSVSNHIRVYVEKTGPIPPIKGFSSSQGNWSLGYAEGLFSGMLEVLKISYEFVSVRSWQSAFRITGKKDQTKNASYQISHRMFPCVDLQTPKGNPRDGRCDSLLIAEYGRRLFTHGGK